MTRARRLLSSMDLAQIKQVLDEQSVKTRDKYPGLGLTLRYMIDREYGTRNYLQYPIGAHPSCLGSKSDIIMIRELAMMDIMEKLTDEKDWHEEVFKDDVVGKWRDRVLAIPDTDFCKLAVKGHQDGLNDDQYVEPELSGVVSETVFGYCIEELLQKARYFEQSGIVPTLDACASVVKSNTLVSPALHEMLRNAFQKLKADRASSPDWHPNSNDMVQNLVDPSLYPLIYDRSRIYHDEVVGVADAIKSWAGKGSVIVRDNGYLEGAGSYSFGRGRAGDLISREAWSEVYQWLPSNVAFKEDGSVRFTSYINNLHPSRYRDIYRTVEKLVEISVPMWDQCLLLLHNRHQKYGPGRKEPRLPNSPESETQVDGHITSYPNSDYNPGNWNPSGPDEVSDDINGIDLEDFFEAFGVEYEKEHMSDPEFSRDVKQYKWEQLRKPIMAEPVASELKIDYMPKEGTRLIDRFSESGLQVIVKMVSIELTPERPSFPADEWHIEGTMNEHVCATSLYYLDSENITTSHRSFRMHADHEVEYHTKCLNVGYGNHYWLQQIYGTQFYGFESNGSRSLRYQYYGAVETREGRLLAFPNVFHNRASGFRLDDPSKPGHQRFIALFLVDPTRRIISTANVPPQRMDWWIESVFDASSATHNRTDSSTSNDVMDILAENGYLASTGAGGASLPPELTDMIKEFYHDGESIPMQAKEAQEHRSKAIKERKTLSQSVDGKGTMYSYSL